MTDKQDPLHEDWYNSESCGHCGIVGGHTPWCRHSRAAPPAQPAPAQEPQCPDCQGPGLLYECVHCGHNNYPDIPTREAAAAQRLSDAQIGEIQKPYLKRGKAGHHAFARAIEAAIVPQWLPIETAPKDGSDVWLHADGKVLRAFWVVKPYRETRDLDGNYLDHQDYEEFWMSCADGDEVEEPTEWQPIPTPPPPKDKP